MKKVNFRLSFLQFSFLAIFIVLFCAVIAVPSLVNGSVRITKKLIIEEEIAEGFLLGLLFILNFLILNLYRKESTRQAELIRKINNDKKTYEERLDESFRYIGQVNVQIQQIRLIFNDKERFPETNSDFRKTLFYFSERVFGIVNAGWVLFRVISTETRRTIREQFEVRHGLTFDYPHVSNKLILEEQCCPPFTAVISNPHNLNILVCCVLPVEKLSNDERVFIQAITNEITMLYVILNSTHYKRSGRELPGSTSIL
jgi:hypothetical protein